MLHSVLITGHASAGVVALVLGCLVLRPPAASRAVVFRLYLGALLTLVALLVAVVVVDWPGLETGERVTFAPLTILGLYTAWRGLRARRVLVDRPTGWRPAYVDHVGFTLISLFDGFAVVGASISVRPSRSSSPSGCWGSSSASSP